MIKNSKETYIKQLDGLRFFAVLMVMASHWVQQNLPLRFLQEFPFINGVNLFFVLSGFLITGMLLRNKYLYESKELKKTSLIKNFYIRRVLRIFPIYYLLIFTFFIFNYQNTREIFPWLVSYTTNIYQSINNAYIGEFNHFWSLAVEEQFYLLWPILLLFAKPKKIIYIIIGTIGFAFLTRLYLYFYVGNWMATSYFTISCMLSLGVGGLLAYVKENNLKLMQLIASRKVLIFSFILYVLGLLFQHYYSSQFYKEIVDVCTFSILAAAIIARASSNGFTTVSKFVLESKFVVHAGKISYGMYVYHLFIPSLYLYLSTVLGVNVQNKILLFFIYYLMTFILSHLSWRFIENPINRLKTKFPYYRK